MCKSARLLAVLALPLVVTGCGLFVIGGAAVGAGAIVWNAGWHQAELPAAPERVVQASAAALRDFKWDVDLHEFDGKDGVVDAFQPDGRRVVVKIKRLGDRKTRVRIRAGLLGNKAESQRVLDQIKKNL